MCEVAGLFVGVKLKLNNSSVTVPEMPQALDNVNELLSQQFIGLPPSQSQGMAQQEQQVPGVANFQQQQGLGNLLPVTDDVGAVGEPPLTMPADWDPAVMGSMDWTAGYENILNLMQDELQILENYPNAGLF